MTASQWVRSISVGLLIAAFCLPALLFLVRLPGGGGMVSETERRALQSLPTFNGQPRDFTADMDDYFEDHFGLRMPLIRTARTVRDNLGEDPPNVVYGKEDWLFLGQADYRDEFEGQGQWSASQVEDWISSFSKVKAELDNRNIPFAAVIAIDKARAYPEYLPDDWREGLRRFRSALHAHRRVGETGLLDAEPHVMRAKAQRERVFYKRDTHWTAAGTYDLAMAIIDRLDPTGVLPRYQPGPKRERVITRLLDLDAMAGFETSNEPPVMMIGFPAYGPDGLTRLDPDTAESPFQGQFATLRADGTLKGETRRLVIVGDSFADSMLAHFLPSFSEIIRIHHGAHLFDVSLNDVKAYEPDAVLFISAERQAAKKPTPFAPL